MSRVAQSQDWEEGREGGRGVGGEGCICVVDVLMNAPLVITFAVVVVVLPPIEVTRTTRREAITKGSDRTGCDDVPLSPQQMKYKKKKKEKEKHPVAQIYIKEKEMIVADAG